MNEKIIINQYWQVNFEEIIILNTELTVTEIKHCQLQNTLVKLDHT